MNWMNMQVAWSLYGPVGCGSADDDTYEVEFEVEFMNEEGETLGLCARALRINSLSSGRLKPAPGCL